MLKDKLVFSGFGSSLFVTSDVIKIPELCSINQ